MAKRMHSSLFALALVAACTVHHVVEDSNGPTGGGAEVARSLDLRLGEELVVGSGTHGALSTTEGEAVAHPFIGAAGATVGARIENAPQFARVGIRGPVTGGARRDERQGVDPVREIEGGKLGDSVRL